MKKGLMRVALLLLASALLVTGVVLGTSAETEEGGNIADVNYYAGTQTQNGSKEGASGWQTNQLGALSSCPKGVKLWEEGNGLWLSFEYYHDKNSTTACEIRLRSDKPNAIFTIKGGAITASATYFPDAATEDSGVVHRFENDGWHHILVKVNQDTVINESGTDVEHSWDATLWADGVCIGTYAGVPKYLASDHGWKLYEASLSPDGVSIDYERVSATPSGNYLRFYFYGGNLFNQDEENREMRAQVRLRNIRAYFGDDTDVPASAPITYHLNGGSLPTERVEAITTVSSNKYVAIPYHEYYDLVSSSCFYTVGERVSDLPVPVRLGYEFTGWYSDEALTTRVERIDSDSTEAVALYAGWRHVATVLEYELDGGTFGNDEPQREILFGESGVTLADPTKKHYKFIGWLIDDATTPVTGELAIIGAPETLSVKLTAVWELVSAFVEYELDGGAFEAGAVAPDSVLVGSSRVEVPDPVRLHYEFLGWSIDGSAPEKGTVSYDASTPGAIASLTACWKRTEGAIAFVAPSSVSLSGKYTSIFALEGETEVVFPTVPAVDGMVFRGWYLTPNFAGNPMTEFTVTEQLLAEEYYDITFYGKFERTFCDLTYDSLSMAPFGISYVNTDGIEIGDEIKDGALHLWKPMAVATDYYILTASMLASIPIATQSFTFEFAIKGTYQSEGSSGLRFRKATSGDETQFLSFGKTGDISVGGEKIATLDPENYQTFSFVITFADGAMLVDAYVDGVQKLMGKSISSKLGPVDKDDNTMDIGRCEWSLLGRAKYDLYFDFMAIAEGSTPRYTEITERALRYETNGGTLPADAPSVHVLGETTTLPTPVRSGYIFDGWYTLPTFESISRITEIGTAATDVPTLYARWISGFIADLSGGTENAGFAEWIDQRTDGKSNILFTAADGALLIEKRKELQSGVTTLTTGEMTAGGFDFSGDCVTLEFSMALPEGERDVLGMAMQLVFGRSRVEFLEVNNNSGVINLLVGDKKISLGTLTETEVHYAFAFDFASGDIDVYVDGVAVQGNLALPQLAGYAASELDGIRTFFAQKFTGSVAFRDYAATGGSLPILYANDGVYIAALNTNGSVTQTRGKEITLPDTAPAWVTAGGALYAAGETVSIKANTTFYAVSVELLAGASIRLDSVASGLRFETAMTEGLARALAAGGLTFKVGTLVVPTDKLGETVFTKEALLAAGIKFVEMTTKHSGVIAQKGVYTLYATLTDIFGANYTRAFSAISYIEVEGNGASYVSYTAYSEGDNSRSVYEVAAKAYVDGAALSTEQLAILESYLDSVVVLDADLKLAGGIDGYVSPYTVSYDGSVITISIEGGEIAEGDIVTLVIDGRTYTSGWTVSDGKVTGYYAK